MRTIKSALPYIVGTLLLIPTIIFLLLASSTPCSIASGYWVSYTVFFVSTLVFAGASLLAFRYKSLRKAWAGFHGVPRNVAFDVDEYLAAKNAATAPEPELVGV